MKRSTKIILLSVLILAGIGALVVSGTALAQDSNQTTGIAACVPGLFKGVMGGRGYGNLWLSQTSLEAASELLGLTPDELKAQLGAGENLADLAEKANVDLQTLCDAVEAAQTADKESRIQAAVANGNITQAEADWLLKGLDLGFSRGFGRELWGYGIKGELHDTILEVVAKAIGIETQDLSNQLWAGRPLADIVEKAGADLQAVLDVTEKACQESLTQYIQQAVADGRLTQEQADWLLEGLKNGYRRFGWDGGFGLGTRSFGHGRFGGSHRK